MRRWTTLICPLNKVLWNGPFVVNKFVLNSLKRASLDWAVAHLLLARNICDLRIPDNENTKKFLHQQSKFISQVGSSSSKELNEVAFA